MNTLKGQLMSFFFRPVLLCLPIAMALVLPGVNSAFAEKYDCREKSMKVNSDLWHTNIRTQSIATCLSQTQQSSGLAAIEKSAISQVNGLINNFANQRYCADGQDQTVYPSSPFIATRKICMPSGNYYETSVIAWDFFLVECCTHCK